MNWMIESYYTHLELIKSFEKEVGNHGQERNEKINEG